LRLAACGAQDLLGMASTGSLHPPDDSITATCPVSSSKLR
jgi:hypothetical protein